MIQSFERKAFKYLFVPPFNGIIQINFLTNYEPRVNRGYIIRIKQQPDSLFSSHAILFFSLLSPVENHSSEVGKEFKRQEGFTIICYPAIIC